MSPTGYPHVNDLIDRLLAGMQSILGAKLVGLYLYGSLVTGDFDANISDVDLLAAISDELDEAEFAALDRLHHQIANDDPQWLERIEIAYYTLHGLTTFKTEASPIAIISPGEAFNVKLAGSEWLMNWYMVQTIGVTLYGPSPDTIIAPTSLAEFIEAVKAHVAFWREWIDDVYNRHYQAYVILTLCRGWYTVTHGEQVSKRKAALWAAAQLPQWSSLIQNALHWRENIQEDNVDHPATLPETRRFAHEMIDRILSGASRK